MFYDMWENWNKTSLSNMLIITESLVSEREFEYNPPGSMFFVLNHYKKNLVP